MRIAVDIDSTLHHYWDQFSAIAKKRFGVDLDYETQLTWEISRLRPEQARACVAESHTAAHILAAVPYPGAVETIRAWHEAGHFIHVTSPSHDRGAGGHGGVARPDRDALRRAVLLVRQGQPLHRARASTC